MNVEYRQASASDITPRAAETGLCGHYEPSMPGAASWREARPLYVEGKHVTAEVENVNGAEWLTVFVGGAIVLSRPLPEQITNRGQVNSWVAMYVTAHNAHADGLLDLLECDVYEVPAEEIEAAAIRQAKNDHFMKCESIESLDTGEIVGCSHFPSGRSDTVEAIQARYDAAKAQLHARQDSNQEIAQKVWDAHYAIACADDTEICVSNSPVYKASRKLVIATLRTVYGLSALMADRVYNALIENGESVAWSVEYVKSTRYGR